MSLSTLSTKGQLVIPTNLRKALNLQPGDAIEVTLEGNRLILKPSSSRAAKLTRGRFGRPVLLSAPGAPEITTETVNALLDDLP